MKSITRRAVILFIVVLAIPLAISACKSQPIVKKPAKPLQQARRPLARLMPWSEREKTLEKDLIPLDEAQKAIAYKMPVPQKLPEGISVKGAHVVPGPYGGQVDILFTNGLHISAMPFPDSSNWNPLAALTEDTSSIVPNTEGKVNIGRQVMVNGQPAFARDEDVQKTFRGDIENENGVVWGVNVDAGPKATYVVYDLRSANLTVEELIPIAESVPAK